MEKRRNRHRKSHYNREDGGLTSHQRDDPGGSSSQDPTPKIKAFKVIKIEVEDDSDEDKGQKFILTLLAAIVLSMIGQWLFGKCAKRYKTRSTPIERPEEQEESDFEIVSEPEEATEEQTEARTEAQTEAEPEEATERSTEEPIASRTNEVGRSEQRTEEVQTERQPTTEVPTMLNLNQGEEIA